MTRRTLSTLAAAACAFTLTAMPAAPAALQAGPPPGVAFITVQGRLIRVEFHLYEQHASPWNPAGLVAATRVSTTDPRGLPADLRPAFENVIHGGALIWTTHMPAVPTFAYNPNVAILASDTTGPDLAPGNNAAAVLWLRDSHQAYRAASATVPIQSYN